MLTNNNKEVKWCKIGFNFDDKLFIIKPLSKKELGAIKLTSPSKGEHTSKLIINAELTEKIARISGVKGTARFLANWNDKFDFLEVDLSEPHDEN